MSAPANGPLPAPERRNAALLARAYGVVLSWPCPACGAPYPCEHDAAKASDDRAIAAQPAPADGADDRK